MKTIILLAALAASAQVKAPTLSEEEKLSVSRAQTVLALAQRARLEAEKREAEAIGKYTETVQKIFAKHKLDPSKCDIGLDQEIRCQEPPK